LAAAPQKESNLNFTYRHSNCSQRLLPATQQCGIFIRVARFIWHISEYAARAESKYIFTGTLESCDSALLFRRE